jgi:hypothetical protein
MEGTETCLCRIAKLSHTHGSKLQATVGILISLFCENLTIKLVVKRHKYKYLEFSGFLLENLFVQEHNWAFPSRNKKKSRAGPLKRTVGNSIGR